MTHKVAGVRAEFIHELAKVYQHRLRVQGCIRRGPGTNLDRYVFENVSVEAYLESVTPVIHVKDDTSERIVIKEDVHSLRSESRDSISLRTLQMMDRAIEEIDSGITHDPIDLTKRYAFEDEDA